MNTLNQNIPEGNSQENKRLIESLLDLPEDPSMPCPLSESISFSQPPTRSNPDPKLNPNDTESDLPQDESNLKLSSKYSTEDKYRRDLAVTENDLKHLEDITEIPYRRILFSKIPNQQKPKYEQEEVLKACCSLMDLLEIREKYIFYDEFNLQHPLIFAIQGNKAFPTIHQLASPEITWNLTAGVVTFNESQKPVITQLVSAKEYFSDLHLLLKSMSEAVNKSFCHKRLKLLQSKFNLHLMCNSDRESFHQKFKNSRNFNNVKKVDNHIHLAGAMNQKHLQKFMKKKLVHQSDEIVGLSRTGEPQSLQQVFTSLGITCENLTVDVLDMSADHNIFHRFDRFNLKFNPIGTPLLREVFLKTDNYLKGKYFAEISKELIFKLELEKTTLAEFRISIYGRNQDEWLKLAIWFNSHQLKSKCVKWLIQVPRLYSLYKASKQVNSFQDLLANLFTPVVEASLHPERFPEVSKFLEEIVGFDSVDDESKNENIGSYSNFRSVMPEDWTSDENPPYSYYCYYMYANIFNINQLRAARGLNTFAFRPHGGESGSIDHMAAAYLTSHSINHGIELQTSPVLQYLFYLKQIGLSMSPLSNNKLFLKFVNNPFLKFFQRGLNVTLSTDAPLVFHLTREGLVEEYSVAAQALDLSDVSLCEIARNSLIQSGFTFQQKAKWLGVNFMQGTPDSNDFNRTGLSWIRYSYRFETFMEEFDYIQRHAEKSNSYKSF